MSEACLRKCPGQVDRYRIRGDRVPCPTKPNHPTPVQDMHTGKGCVHWYDVGAAPGVGILKARPVIIIGRDKPLSKRVLVCPLTDPGSYIDPDTGKLKYPFHALLLKRQNPFLDKDSVVLLDQVYTVAKSDLCSEWFIGRVIDLAEVDNAILYNYDLFEHIGNLISDLLAQNAQGRAIRK